MVCDVARHKSHKALKGRQYIHRAFNLFDLLLLLLQRGAVQVQQCGGDANRKVAGVHLVLVSALQDVMKDADQMFQKGFIRPRKLVRYPGSKNGEGPLQKKENRQKTIDWRVFFFFFASACQIETKGRSVLTVRYTRGNFCQIPLKISPVFLSFMTVKISILITQSEHKGSHTICEVM